MLEFSFGKDGIKSKIGMGGTNISYQNLRNVAAGYKEASKVTDWKYGNEQSSSTLNSINMLGYTNSGMNIQLSKDIWSEKLAVEYGDTGNDYGNYTIGERKFVNSVESLTYIQNKLNEWGYPSYSYNIKGSVSTAFFRGH